RGDGLASSLRKHCWEKFVVGKTGRYTETAGPYGKKQVHDRAGLPYFFRNVVAYEHPGPNPARYHQQLSREPDCRRISCIRLFYRLRRDVDSRWFFDGTFTGRHSDCL